MIMKIKPLNVLFNVFIIFTVLTVGFVSFNVFTGTKGYAVVTDSMAPTLKKGDVVFVKEVEFDTLEAGDVVTVAFADGSGYFTHKITSIDYIAGAIRTKGDANQSEDPQPSMGEQIVGKMWYSVPLLGYISIGFSQVNPVELSMIIAIILIVVVIASMIVPFIRKRGGKNE